MQFPGFLPHGLTRALLPAVLLLTAAPTAAQESALIEAIAPVIAAEDAREWREAPLRAALVYPDSLVRRTAAVASGNAGASALIGPSSRIARLTMPRAGRPENTLVSAV